MGRIGQSISEESFGGANKPVVRDATSVEETLSGVFSTTFAERASLAPLRRDTATNTMTIAVSDVARVSVVSAVFKFLLQPTTIEFKTVTPKELQEAQARFRALAERVVEPVKPKGRLAVSGSSVGKPGVSPPAAGNRVGLFKLGGGGAKPSVPLPGYAEMGLALQAAVSMLACERLKQSPELPAVQAKVRHCQMLATRLVLSESQIDAVVLAAWLSSMPGSADVLMRLPNPYRLDRILAPSPDEPAQVEARILDVVRAYESFGRENADESHDVSAVRRRLCSTVSGGLPDVVEPFLQILMDEQFLASLERKSGSILLADPAEQVTATLAVPLTADGYIVETVPSVAGIHSRLAASPPDMLIVSAALPGGSILGLCRDLKQQEATRHVPVLVLTDPADSKQAVDFMRAGADDVLAHSVGPELTLLKVERLMGRRTREGHAGGKGVTGALRDMALVDMVQILAAGGRNVEIRLRHDRNEGRLFIREGAIIHAVCGTKEGAAAFFELMRWHEGTFMTLPCKDFPERTVQETMMGLLMEGARQADERQESGH